MPTYYHFVLYLGIGIQLWRRQAKTEVLSLGNSHRRTRMTVQVTKMLVVSVVAVAVCWLPQHVVLFIAYFILDRCPPKFLWFGGTLLAHANSATNPIIYVAFHSECRKQLKVILRCGCFPMCAGLCKARTGNVLNIQGERKAWKMEEFDQYGECFFL